jgi:hypothetical protein
MHPSPVTYAFLFPITGATAPAALSMEPTALAALSKVDFGATKHFAIIEICRRAYKRHAMDLDRADKQAKLGEKR